MTYQTTFYDKDGKASFTVNPTNGFLKGDFNAPENITVIGGKNRYDQLYSAVQRCERRTVYIPSASDDLEQMYL